jgi:hypothetical protein
MRRGYESAREERVHDGEEASVCGEFVVGHPSVVHHVPEGSRFSDELCVDGLLPELSSSEMPHNFICHMQT